ncbi:hypothetical protein GCM10029964_083260 [Kibdelosporangium lantanae]
MTFREHRPDGDAGGPALPVLFVHEERLVTTTLCLAVGYGARDDPPGFGGAAHLLEHLLMAAPVAGGESLCERVERLGGEANAETGLDMMLFTAQVHGDDAAQVLPWLQQAVTSPSLTRNLLHNERDVVLQELAAAAADPCDVVQDAFLECLFDGSPLARPVGGTRADLDSVTVDDIEAVHRRLFRSRPAVLVVVGPRCPVDVTTPSGPVFASQAELVGGAVPAVPTRDGIDWPDEFCWTSLGARAPAIGDERRHAFVVLAKLMGSSPSSLLYRALRTENALAYAFQSWYRGYDDVGAWRVLIGLEPENGPKVVDIVRYTVDQIAAGRTKGDDLAAARRQAQLQLVRDAETPWERARQVAVNTRCGTRTWSIEDEVAAIGEVDTADVAAAATAVSDGWTAVVRPSPS